jgi:ribose transport system permease protein
MEGKVEDTMGLAPPRRGAGSTIKKALKMRETGLIAIILVLFLVMSFASPYFLTWVNVRTMVMAFAVEGIVVVGMTILLISGGIDLSVGSVTALAMVVAGWLFLAGVDPWISALIAIAACTGVGAFMGFFVTRVGLHHFIVSLAVMVIARGICLLGTGGRPLGLYTLPPEF